MPTTVLPANASPSSTLSGSLSPRSLGGRMPVSRVPRRGDGIDKGRSIGEALKKPPWPACSACLASSCSDPDTP
jgi:hypothetical protein